MEELTPEEIAAIVALAKIMNPEMVQKMDERKARE